MPDWAITLITTFAPQLVSQLIALVTAAISAITASGGTTNSPQAQSLQNALNSLHDVQQHLASATKK